MALKSSFFEINDRANDIAEEVDCGYKGLPDLKGGLNITFSESSEDFAWSLVLAFRGDPGAGFSPTAEVEFWEAALEVTKAGVPVLHGMSIENIDSFEELTETLRRIRALKDADTATVETAHEPEEAEVPKVPSERSGGALSTTFKELEEHLLAKGYLAKASVDVNDEGTEEMRVTVLRVFDTYAASRAMKLSDDAFYLIFHEDEGGAGKQIQNIPVYLAKLRRLTTEQAVKHIFSSDAVTHTGVEEFDHSTITTLDQLVAFFNEHISDADEATTGDEEQG